jgi:hypothetical protein
MKARIAILIALMIFGGIGADWWMDGVADPTGAADVTAMDGPDTPPPSPNP